MRTESKCIQNGWAPLMQHLHGVGVLSVAHSKPQSLGVLGNFVENSENKASGEYRTIMLAMLPYKPLSKPHPYHPISKTNHEWLLPMQTRSLIIRLLTIIRTIMTIRLLLIPVRMIIRDGLSIDHVQWTNGFSPNPQSMHRLARGPREQTSARESQRHRRSLIGMPEFPMPT